VELGLNLVPFSRYGAYIAFSHLEGTESREEGLYFRSVRGPAPGSRPLQEIFLIQLIDGDKPVSFKEIASPTVLRLVADSGYVEICIPEPRVVRIRCTGITLRLSMKPTVYDMAIPRGEKRWQVTHTSACEIKYMLSSLKGSLVVDAPWNMIRSERMVIDLVPDPDTQVGELAIEEYITTWQERDYPETFDACLAAVADEFVAWQAKLPEAPSAYAQSRRLAAYITWSCVVVPDGYLTRPAMYMSKNWMASI
jgi:hypothetical protein